MTESLVESELSYVCSDLITKSLIRPNSEDLCIWGVVYVKQRRVSVTCESELDLACISLGDVDSLSDS